MADFTWEEQEAAAAAREVARGAKVRLRLTVGSFFGVAGAVILGNLVAAMIIFVIYQLVK